MDLDDLQRHWDAFGRTDPLWAILTDPSRKGGRWTAAEFFATGENEIAALMAEARRFGLPHQRRRGLDFGCGVGRLTQALAEHVDTVVGLDVAPSMIAHAREANRHGDRVRYAVQDRPPFAAIADRSVDLVVTGRVLQHIAPEYSRAYVRELARVLAPGGFLSFDLPSRVIDTPAMPAGAMPAGAYRAALTARWHPHEHGVLQVTVANHGSCGWPAGVPLNVGNHWRAGDGTMLVLDDRRVAVPLPLGPKESAAVTLSVSWPPPEAATLVELDVVHEAVAWFADLGSPTARLDVPGTAPMPPLSPPAPTAGFEPVMEMHAVPRGEVEGLLAAAGVQLLQVRPEAHCGPRWEAWRYDVTADRAR